MTQINIRDMEVAQLNNEQLNRLKEAERDLNNAGGGQEIYLLAVARHQVKQ